MILCGSGSASEFFSLVKHSLKGLLKNLIFKFYSLHFVIFIYFSKLILLYLKSVLIELGIRQKDADLDLEL